MEFKERLFLFLSSIFLTSLVVGNIVGTTKFVYVFGLTVPAGTLAYPFTFLATDLICELYGKKRAKEKKTYINGFTKEVYTSSGFGLDRIRNEFLYVGTHDVRSLFKRCIWCVRSNFYI